MWSSPYLSYYLSLLLSWSAALARICLLRMTEEVTLGNMPESAAPQSVEYAITGASDFQASVPEVRKPSVFKQN